MKNFHFNVCNKTLTALFFGLLVAAQRLLIQQLQGSDKQTVQQTPDASEVVYPETTAPATAQDTDTNPPLPDATQGQLDFLLTDWSPFVIAQPSRGVKGAAWKAWSRMKADIARPFTGKSR